MQNFLFVSPEREKFFKDPKISPCKKSQYIYEKKKINK